MPSLRVQDFVPPVCLKAARLIRTRGGGGQDFASYAEAVARCQGAGYQTDDLVEVIFQKTAAYRVRCTAPEGTAMGLPEALLLATVGMDSKPEPEVLRVLDFGGACGAHYFLTRSLIPPQRRMDWRVVETPAMIARARASAPDELRFFSSIAAAGAESGRIDLAYSSSALQYTPDPAQTLDALLALEARYVVLTRLGLTTGGNARITVQESRLADNGPGAMPPGLRIANRTARYPVTFLPRAAVETALARRYAITVNVPDTSVFGAGQPGLTGRAYIARLKQSL